MMGITRTIKTPTLALTVALLGAGGAVATGDEQRPIRIDGSSTLFPVTFEAARRFQRAQPGSSIQVEFSGSGAGFRAFCRGEIDVANASRDMNAHEQAECAKHDIHFRQLPVAIDSIAIVVNPANRWADDITVEELKTLWAPEAEEKITTWKAIREHWPDEPVELFGRGQNSGTYDVFTEAIVGQAHRSRHDYHASEDEEALARGIADSPNALGFFGIGAYHRHWDELKLVAVDAGKGPVYPTLATVGSGDYQPLTRPLYLYVNERSLTGNPRLREFLTHYLTHLRSWIHFTGFMPLDAGGYQQSLQRLGAGAPVGARP
ncbi:PstS family phosphate ABC transporter substrate-binding protein [Stutzerimonas nosocomialis]|uniref:PstS family phosphate ABC transporter substrate-binding protein n=1 Tax=Stutzerimonas nosocomialis TaxID=1056496 RepID=UPI001F4F1C9F|nr:PstS family phosphate ABC transporter substrate-binding protein [Stutzerimonas nosocomialis]